MFIINAPNTSIEHVANTTITISVCPFLFLKNFWKLIIECRFIIDLSDVCLLFNDLSFVYIYICDMYGVCIYILYIIGLFVLANIFGA